MSSVLQENEKNLGLTDSTNPDICELFETQVTQNQMQPQLFIKVKV